MQKPDEFSEFELLESWGEDFEDAYYDGEDLDDAYMTSVHLLEEILDNEEWETF